MTPVSADPRSVVDAYIAALEGDTRQVAFAEWTAGDKLRQPVFLGLRRDKSPRECRWDERER